MGGALSTLEKNPLDNDSAGIFDRRTPPTEIESNEIAPPTKEPLVAPPKKTEPIKEAPLIEEPTIVAPLVAPTSATGTGNSADRAANPAKIYPVGGKLRRMKNSIRKRNTGSSMKKSNINTRKKWNKKISI